MKMAKKLHLTVRSVMINGIVITNGTVSKNVAVILNSTMQSI
jgi:hypothetical protein